MKLSVFSLSLLALLTPLAAAWSKEGKYIPADMAPFANDATE